MQFNIKVREQSWSIVYDKAVRDDGSFLFPEKLSEQFLAEQRKTLGTYIYANQYQNEIIPESDQDFKRHWLRYYKYPPENKKTYAFIDPAISLEDNACYTAYVIVDVDEEGTWYLNRAQRIRITATETVDLFFKLHELYKPDIIGVEEVAYQTALIHFTDKEMRHRNQFIPLQGLRRGPDKSKSMRIRKLVPRFELGRILVKEGLDDFEDEYLKFPRGQYVDILDALASIEEISDKAKTERPLHDKPSRNARDYERYYIEQKAKELENQFESGW